MARLGVYVRLLAMSGRFAAALQATRLLSDGLVTVTPDGMPRYSSAGCCRCQDVSLPMGRLSAVHGRHNERAAPHIQDAAHIPGGPFLSSPRRS